jgi:NADH-quinone oxidoreductase subunit L
MSTTSILNLTWLIPLFPFLAFLGISTFAHQERELSHRLAIAGVAIAFVLSLVVFWTAATLPIGGGESAFESPLVHWFTTGTERFTLGVYVDPITAVMLLLIAPISLMILIFSLGDADIGRASADIDHASVRASVKGTPSYSHFYAQASLLTASVLGTVVFDNLLASFMFWGITDACAYFLIGLSYDKEPATQAGLRAFLVTGVGNLLLVLGLVLLYAATGSLAYRDILSAETLAHLSDTRFLGTQFSTATAIALLFFGGAIGKSAQFPLHTWLTESVAAPAPALALIHTIATGTAGIYLLMRTFPILALADVGVRMSAVVVIGASTAILASIIAVAQNDIRRVLAFSTVSQLGCIVTALGIGAYVAGAFHLITHAFFKTLLLLGSGSVIRGMETGQAEGRRQETGGTRPEQGVDDLQAKGFDASDMMDMGGLAQRMPRTFWAFLAGGLALSAFPVISAGFWSTNGILSLAYQRNRTVFWVLAAVTGLTAFYTMRQIGLVFLGQPRSEAAVRASESASSMTVPLLVLAIFAVGLGWVGIPKDFPVVGGLAPDWFHQFVGPAFDTAYIGGQLGQGAGHLGEVTVGLIRRPLLVGSALSLGGLVLGWLVYARKPLLGGLVLGWLAYGWKPLLAGEKDRLETGMRRVWLGWLYACIHERFYLDHVYRATLGRGVILLADMLRAFDERVLNGATGLAGHAARDLSSISAWFDIHILDVLVNLAGRTGKGVSQTVAALELHVVDRLADLVRLSTRALSDLSAAVDVKVIDRAVEGIGGTVKAGERFLHPVETGNVRDYLLRASLMVLTLIVVSFVILFLHI